MGKREGSENDLPHLAVYLWRNRRQLCRGAAIGKVSRPVPETRPPRSKYEALVSGLSEAVSSDSLGDEPASAFTRHSHHQSPLSQGDRAGVTGDTLGSEACSTTSQYADDEHDSGGGLPPISEGDEGARGPPSPNATVPEGAAAEVAQKAAEIQKLSPVKSGRKIRGQL